MNERIIHGGKLLFMNSRKECLFFPSIRIPQNPNLNSVFVARYRKTPIIKTNRIKPTITKTNLTNLNKPLPDLIKPNLIFWIIETLLRPKPPYPALPRSETPVYHVSLHYRKLLLLYLTFFSDYRGFLVASAKITYRFLQIKIQNT